MYNGVWYLDSRELLRLDNVIQMRNPETRMIKSESKCSFQDNRDARTMKHLQKAFKNGMKSIVVKEKAKIEAIWIASTW